jgi:uncharacterized membrane protein YciS (DUF1049 family)
MGKPSLPITQLPNQGDANMDTQLIVMTVLGFALVFSPIVVGAYYLREWRTENRRLNRRIRDLE